MLHIDYIGDPTEQSEPGPNVQELLGALARWILDPGLNLADNPAFESDPLRAPFRGPAWAGCHGQVNPDTQKMQYTATRPSYPDLPGVVRYFGKFIEVRFGFSLDTDDQALIAMLDAAIEANMKRPEYLAAALIVDKRRTVPTRR